jgi:uncharacterized membrane protein
MLQSLRVITGVLSIAGLADALYFTLAYYGRVRRARWVPQILCAREGSSCVTVLRTPYARVFRVPNSLLGIVYYLLLLGWGLTARRLGAFYVVVYARALPLGWVLAVGGALPVILGLYLIYALHHKLHVPCPLCYTAHGINLALFVVLLAYCCAAL